MSPISWLFRGFMTLIAKLTNPVATSASVDRSGEMYQVLPVSEALARFVGENEISFFTAIGIVGKYIEDHNLLNPENTEEVLCDDKLKTILEGKDKVVGLKEMVELLMRHFPYRSETWSKVADTEDARTKLFYKVEEVSEPLASFLGERKASRATAMRDVWRYVNAHDLWEKEFSLLKFSWITKKKMSERSIRCDEKLKTIFDGKDKIGMKEFVVLLMRYFPDRKLDD